MLSKRQKGESVGNNNPARSTSQTDSPAHSASIYEIDVGKGFSKHHGARHYRARRGQSRDLLCALRGQVRAAQFDGLGIVPRIAATQTAGYAVSHADQSACPGV